MKVLLLWIVLFSFLQSAFLNLNLVLVILIARSLVLDDGANLLLAFFGGLILSFLTQTNLGYWPLVLVFIVKLGHFIKKMPISFSPFVVFSAGLVLVFLAAFLNSLFINQIWQFLPRIFEAVLIVPAYFLIRFWEDRFEAKSHYKLKV